MDFLNNLSVIDIIAFLVVAAIFVTGMFKGFLKSLTTVLALGITYFLVIVKMDAFEKLLGTISEWTGNANASVAILFVLIWIVLVMVLGVIFKALNRTIIFNNFLMNILGGIVYTAIWLVVFSLVIEVFQLKEVLPNYSGSYLEQVVNYINQFVSWDKVQENVKGLQTL